MGNYASCSLTPLMLKTPKATRVIFPGGEIKQYIDEIKAAELMLECPSFFISDSNSLHIGKRFESLAADEELKQGSVYIMFPMKRLNSIVTAADIATFLMAANSSSKRISNGRSVRVIPDSDVNVHRSPTRLSLEGIEGLSINEMNNNRSFICRSKKPLLETIKEEPVVKARSVSCIYSR